MERTDMQPNSRAEAQQRVDDIRIFQAELARLEADKVLLLDQAQRSALADYHHGLLAHYAHSFHIDRNAQAKQLSLGMRVASLIGALALAASVFLLFYQFWGYFSSTAQVAILIASSSGLFGATMALQRIDDSGYFTKLAAMVAFAGFVLNIVMLGQIFNITASDKALLPLAALALLLAYSCDLPLLLVAGILCLIAYIAARVGTWGGLYWLDFGSRPENFFLPAVLLFCFPQWVSQRRFGGFARLYRIFGLLTLCIPLLILGHAGEYSYLNIDPAIVKGLYQVMGFVVSALVIWLGVRRHWPEVVNTGITFFVIFLYTKFFDWWWELMPKYLFFLLLGLAAILILLVLQRLRRFGRGSGAGAS